MKKLFALSVLGLLCSATAMASSAKSGKTDAFKNGIASKIASNNHYSGHNDDTAIQFDMNIKGTGEVVPITVTGLKIDYAPKGKKGCSITGASGKGTIDMGSGRPPWSFKWEGSYGKIYGTLDIGPGASSVSWDSALMSGGCAIPPQTITLNF